MQHDDSFGSRMKLYEGIETERRLMPLLPAMARLDGMCFSKFTKPLKEDTPFSAPFSLLMVETTRFLVQETNALMGYTQSDEISLVWRVPSFDSQLMFDGRIQKMVSYLAGLCSAYFNLNAPFYLGEAFMRGKMPQFDCRVWNVPSDAEAANTLLWREKDATKNSISMAAQHHYSHNELMNKSSSEKQEMLFKKGVNWNEYPDYFKRGTFIQKRMVKRKFTPEELEKLPEKHEARRNPDLEVERGDIVTLAMPSFGKVANRVDVIFSGAEPVLISASG